MNDISVINVVLYKVLAITPENKDENKLSSSL